MRILDLFSGLGGERRRQYIEAQGHEYWTLDIEKKFKADMTADIMTLTKETIGYYDFIWASVPCETWSVASIGHHWTGGKGAYIPKSEAAKFMIELVKHTIELCKHSSPKFIIENPRGVLRKMPFMQEFDRQTVTYCQYGETRMKPTDIWVRGFEWKGRPMCKNGDKCHEAAPRGAKTGTQGLGNAAERSVVPLDLWFEILDAAA